MKAQGADVQARADEQSARIAAHSRGDTPPREGARPSFFVRVHRASLAIFLVALLLSLQWASWPVAFGLVAGWGMASALLLFWQIIVRIAFRRERPRPLMVGVSLLVKLPVVGVCLWFLISRGLVSPAAFAVGFALPQVAVALLAVGGRRVASKPAPKSAASSPAHLRT